MHFHYHFTQHITNANPEAVYGGKPLHRTAEARSSQGFANQDDAALAGQEKKGDYLGTSGCGNPACRVSAASGGETVSPEQSGNKVRNHRGQVEVETNIVHNMVPPDIARAQTHGLLDNAQAAGVNVRPTRTGRTPDMVFVHNKNRTAEIDGTEKQGET